MDGVVSRCCDRLSVVRVVPSCTEQDDGGGPLALTEYASLARAGGVHIVKCLCADH